MSSFFLMPLNIVSYDKDTIGLSMIEHGCYYNLLRAYYWNIGGPLPDDIDELKQMARAHNEQEVATLNKILLKHFVLIDGFWHQKRADEVLNKCSTKSDKARDSANFRWKKDNAVNANAVRTKCERNANIINKIHNINNKESNSIVDSDTRTIQEKFEEFWEAYGKIGNKRPALINFEKAIKQGVSYE